MHALGRKDSHSLALLVAPQRLPPYLPCAKQPPPPPALHPLGGTKLNLASALPVAFRLDGGAKVSKTPTSVTRDLHKCQKRPTQVAFRLDGGTHSKFSALVYITFVTVNV
jgi:hypothetical protein